MTDTATEQTWYLSVMDGTWATKVDGKLKIFEGGPYEVDEATAELAKNAARRNDKIVVGHKPVAVKGKPDQRGTLTREDVGWLDKERNPNRAAEREAEEVFKLDPNRELGVSYPCPVESCEDADGHHSEYVTKAALDRHIEMNHSKEGNDESQKQDSQAAE